MEQTMNGKGARSSAWVAAALGMAFVALPSAACAATIDFSGYTWEVRQGGGGPGPNHWDARNVRVDADGALHLRVRWLDGRWTSAEVAMTQSLGFGSYQFQLQGRPDLLDRNLVLGLFNYTLPEIGPDGTNEIDIEFAQWGDAANDHGSYTIYPAVLGPKPPSRSFPIDLSSDLSTHRFVWGQRQVNLISLPGLQDLGSARDPIYSAEFAPKNWAHRIPQTPLPVHMNFWLFEGKPPADGQESEMVIKSFEFVPLAR
jgi:hypothetical protein